MGCYRMKQGLFLLILTAVDLQMSLNAGIVTARSILVIISSGAILNTVLGAERRQQTMKIRTIKKRIRRYVTWFAKHKIPKAFKDKRDRNEWIDYIVAYHSKKGGEVG